MLCRELPPWLNESSPHYPFLPVAFDRLHSGGVQFPNAMLTCAETSSGDALHQTQSAFILEDVIGQSINNLGSSGTVSLKQKHDTKAPARLGRTHGRRFERMRACHASPRLLQLGRALGGGIATQKCNRNY